MGQQEVQTWNCPHSLFAAGNGDASDHVLLLCAFLLGFGLDALVCVGLAHPSEGEGMEVGKGLGRDKERRMWRKREETGHMVRCILSSFRERYFLPRQGRRDDERILLVTVQISECCDPFLVGTKPPVPTIVVATVKVTTVAMVSLS